MTVFNEGARVSDGHNGHMPKSLIHAFAQQPLVLKKFNP